MKIFTLIASYMLLSIVANSQASGGGKPFSFSYNLSDEFSKFKVTLPALDVSAMQRKARETFEKGEMLPAGKIFPVSYSPENSGVWTELPNKDRVWRLFIEVPNAPATSLYFDNFYIPEGGVLYVYNAEKTHVIGSFGAHNNTESKEFATELVYTGDCVIEYYEKANVKRQGSFTITGIANVYNAPEPPEYIHLQNPKCCGFGTSGSCNVNVNCPEGAAWSNQKKSVARILIRDGSDQGWCSGSLINNIPGNCKNYFLTANHCGGAVAAADKNQWIFYFNYQSGGCANPASEPGSNTVVGCTMRASASNGANSDVVGSDFLLVEFNNTIPDNYNVFFAGFDASGLKSSNGVSIHHPAADIKKISTYTSALTSRRYYSQLPDNSHWQADWVATATNYGITEGGSSGSPLFNSVGRIVGKLSGGPSSCGAAAANKNDYYGKISYDWISNGPAASQQLKPWLDPNNTGMTSVDGRPFCSTACPDFQEPNNTFATAGVIGAGATNKALIATSTDVDFYRFNINAGTIITATLSTLPMDYDLQLISPGGLVIASSSNGTTSNENISYTATITGTYGLKVLGYNGAFSATSCYTLVMHAQPPCQNIPEPNDTRVAAITINPSVDVYSQIAPAADLDWYKFNNLAGSPNIFITLGNLPADYDLYLYNANNSLLASSATSGTVGESIIFNTNTLGTYYIRVNGFNGASSASLCYRLRVELSNTAKAAWVGSADNKDDRSGLMISPNPVASKLNLNFDAITNAREEVVITNVWGQRVFTSTINTITGKNNYSINLPANLSRGIYFLKVGLRMPVKFMKGG